ncbi:30S ribosomal protein S8e [Candidatus Woesearchaeota archaeon]|nr:30S ribosomal protein S8e [Candidatus Woesearchaeota archaeon]
MVRSNERSNRKETGKKYIEYRKKKKFNLAGVSAFTKIGKRSIRQTRAIGGNKKVKTLSGESVNLFDPKTKKCSKAMIKTVLENPANRHFIRRNILTKGTVVDTEKGKARITSRPGQEGIINAVLI